MQEITNRCKFYLHCAALILLWHSRIKHAHVALNDSSALVSIFMLLITGRITAEIFLYTYSKLLFVVNLSGWCFNDKLSLQKLRKTFRGLVCTKQCFQDQSLIFFKSQYPLQISFAHNLQKSIN